MWWDRMDVQRVGGKKGEGKVDGRFWQLGLALAVIRGESGRRGRRIRWWETSLEKREYKVLWRWERRSSGTKHKQKNFFFAAIGHKCGGIYTEKPALVRRNLHTQPRSRALACVLTSSVAADEFNFKTPPWLQFPQVKLFNGQQICNVAVDF